MLYKKGDRNDPEHYRPIALVNTITKLFTLILYNRLYKWAERRGKLPEWQAWFREKRGTMDHIFTLNALINMQLGVKGDKLFTFFVDLKRAFPSVRHDILWAKLKVMGIRSRLIAVIKNMYDNATIVVRSTEGVSHGCKITMGLLQGEILSPLLLALFIFDLETFLRENGAFGIPITSRTDLLVLPVADDKVFIAKSWSALKKP